MDEILQALLSTKRTILDFKPSLGDSAFAKIQFHLLEIERILKQVPTARRTRS